LSRSLAGPAAGFLDPLAVSLKLALPTSFSRQHSGFALRRFNPDLRRQLRFRGGLTFLPFRQILHSASGELVRGSKGLAVRSVCADKKAHFLFAQSCLGLCRLRGLRILTILLSSKQFRLPAFGISGSQKCSGRLPCCSSESCRDSCESQHPFHGFCACIGRLVRPAMVLAIFSLEERNSLLSPYPSFEPFAGLP